MNDGLFKTLERIGSVLLRPRVRDGEELDGDCDLVTEAIEGSTLFRTE
jgi:hypothetical protein